MSACILVVDDERMNRELLEELLVPEGFAVLQAESGQEALTRIAMGGIDLVLMDVLMPGIDGIETCRRIREKLNERMLPVIMVTAIADRDSRARSKQLGADDFLVKPVFEEELLARVRNLLLRSAYYNEAECERARAEAEVRRWKLVSDVARVVSACKDYQTLQHSIRELLRPHLPVEMFLFLETSGGELFFPASSTVGVHTPTKRIAGARWQRAFHEQSILSASDCQAELWPIAKAVNRGRPVHGAVLPLQVGGNLEGLLLLFTGRELSPEELSLTEELGPHLANAVTNVRSHVKAKELNDARDRLSLLLVHDMKNPLSVIKMNLEMLATQAADEDSQEMVRDSSGAADRMLQMIMDLLDIGRAEEGRLGLRRSTHSVRHLVGETCARYGAAAEARGVALRCDLAPGVLVDADGSLLIRMVENLVGNALRFVPKGGGIDVRSRAEDGHLVLQVRNDGPPIAAAVRERLFEKYGSSEQSQCGPNRGLGLYFCRLVAEAHGGQVCARDVPSGVMFEIRLPRAQTTRLASRMVSGPLTLVSVLPAQA